VVSPQYVWNGKQRQRTSMSQMVQVVSMLDVPSRFGSVSFQSNDVNGAQNSLFLFCNTARLEVQLNGEFPGCDNREREGCRDSWPRSAVKACAVAIRNTGFVTSLICKHGMAQRQQCSDARARLSKGRQGSARQTSATGGRGARC